MLWLITGGIGSGKSAFADDLALTLGHEGIKLYCPPFPQLNPHHSHDSQKDRAAFTWIVIDADENLADKLNAINLESNIFRADRRVLVIDSLSGLLRRIILEAASDDPDVVVRIEALWQNVMTAIIAYEGKMIVVTEEISAGLTFSPLEQWYGYRLAEASRLLSEESRIHYRLIAGVASEVKGYRVKRRHIRDENIYPDR
jgi:adenosylcobinamide kinase/adenosylcobinamide-phosphate guanylyltransferase